MAENNYWSTSGDQGMIKISEDVVASIAAIATAETEGISGLCSSWTSDIAGFLGKKNLSKGVKVQFEGDNVVTDIGILTKYGVGVREVAGQVQENVKTSIESMTGLTVLSVNIHVSGVSFEPKPEPELPTVTSEAE